MGRVDAAVLHGEAAIERNDYLEAPFLAAAARRACASALRARGQAGDLDRAAQLERLAQYAGRALAAGSRRAAARALGSTVPQP
jgi:hypothetical protein